MKLYFNKYIVMLLMLFGIVLANEIKSQSTRSLINEGVDKYNEENYEEAGKNFLEGIDEEFETFEGHFNLGDALYKQGKYDEALSYYKNALSLAKDEFQQSKVFHNIGNSLLKNQKLEESIEAYKNALKLNPDDL
ncbi:MAG: tetratricopeptide repeat protein, partial [Melioribacteraceae bacterium]|nr:tetratricopeptide repeat protein [Melioribacteraceae bacterium]